MCEFCCEKELERKCFWEENEEEYASLENDLNGNVEIVVHYIGQYKDYSYIPIAFCPICGRNLKNSQAAAETT